MPRSFVVAKIAQTLDGKIATASGRSKWITNSAARTHARKVRDSFDAIAVGVDTVIADDPRLTGVKNKDLKKIVFDSNLRIPLSSKVFRTAGDLIIVTTSKAKPSKIVEAETAGATILKVRKKNGRVDISTAISALAELGVKQLLIEGGAHVIGSALKAGCVRRLHVYIAPILFGDSKALNSIVGFDPKDVKNGVKLKITSTRKLKDNLFIEADVHRNR